MSTPKVNIMSLFSTRLLEARKRAAYNSQEEAAKALGMPQQTYGNYESGRSFPKEEILRRIGVVFGVSIDVLLGLNDISESPKTPNVNQRIKKLKDNAQTAAESIDNLLSSISKLEETLR